MTRILGIDPGSQRTGIGIIDIDEGGRSRHVHHAPLMLLGEGDFSQRLKRLLQGLGELIEIYRPDEVAIEKVFMGKSAASALKLGHARGAAICAVVMRDLPVHEYAAKEIKTGAGRQGRRRQGAGAAHGRHHAQLEWQAAARRCRRIGGRHHSRPRARHRATPGRQYPTGLEPQEMRIGNRQSGIGNPKRRVHDSARCCDCPFPIPHSRHRQGGAQ